MAAQDRSLQQSPNPSFYRVRRVVVRSLRRQTTRKHGWIPGGCRYVTAIRWYAIRHTTIPQLGNLTLTVLPGFAIYLPLYFFRRRSYSGFRTHYAS